MSLSYSSLGKDFTMSFPLEALPPRQKAQLFLALCESLGITENYPPDADDTQRMIAAQIKKAWDSV